MTGEHSVANLNLRARALAPSAEKEALYAAIGRVDLGAFDPFFVVFTGESASADADALARTLGASTPIALDDVSALQPVLAARLVIVLDAAKVLRAAAVRKLAQIVIARSASSWMCVSDGSQPATDMARNLLEAIGYGSDDAAAHIATPDSIATWEATPADAGLRDAALVQLSINLEALEAAAPPPPAAPKRDEIAELRAAHLSARKAAETSFANLTSRIAALCTTFSNDLRRDIASVDTDFSASVERARKAVEATYQASVTSTLSETYARLNESDLVAPHSRPLPPLAAARASDAAPSALPAGSVLAGGATAGALAGAVLAPTAIAISGGAGLGFLAGYAFLSARTRSTREAESTRRETAAAMLVSTLERNLRAHLVALQVASDSAIDTYFERRLKDASGA